jgi:SAM-dependent methyltransferase
VPPDPHLTHIVADCAAGRLSPPVALARLLLHGATPDQVAALLAAAPDATDLAALFTARRDGLDAVAATLAEAGAAHGPADTVASIAALFDRAVARAPEASVAAYSLNDPAVLGAATEELVRWLDAEALIGPAADVLDLGCGIGRVAAALRPRVRSVLGLDVSAGMVAEARRRHAAWPGLRFEVTPGTDLAALPDRAFDLVLAVDSFPYLVRAGLADRHAADAARVLRPGGALAILNLSYRGDAAADRADAARWAAAHGFRLAVAGTAPFALWDGTAWVLRRA